MRRWQDMWSRLMNRESLSLGHLCYTKFLVILYATRTVNVIVLLLGGLSQTFGPLVVGALRRARSGLSL